MPAGDHEGGLEGPQDPACRLDGLFGVSQTAEENGELVPAQASQHVTLAQEPTNALGHLYQELVSGLVTQRIVDHLETIEIEEHDTDHAVAPTDLGSGVGQGIDEGDPVRRSGEIVAKCDLPELRVQCAELLIGLAVASPGDGAR